MPGNADGMAVREEREIWNPSSFSCGGESDRVYHGAAGGRAGDFVYTSGVCGFACGFGGVCAGCALWRQRGMSMAVKILLAKFSQSAL